MTAPGGRIAGDLREFLAAVEAEGDLVRIKERVDPRFGVAAYVRRSCDVAGPAFVFEQVLGYPDWQVVGGAYGGLRRLLRVLACDLQTAVARYRAATVDPLPAVRVAGRAPHQAVQWAGTDADLARLPVPTQLVLALGVRVLPRNVAVGEAQIVQVPGEVGPERGAGVDLDPLDGHRGPSVQFRGKVVDGQVGAGCPLLFVTRWGVAPSVAGTC